MASKWANSPHRNSHNLFILLSTTTTYIHRTFAMQIKSRRGDIHVKVHRDVHRFPKRSILDAFPTPDA